MQQVPEAKLRQFDFMTDDESDCSVQTSYIFPGSTPQDFKCRQIYSAMVSTLDDDMAAIVGALQSRGVWNDTLMVLSADNGGPLVLDESGSNNYPVRCCSVNKDWISQRQRLTTSEWAAPWEQVLRL